MPVGEGLGTQPMPWIHRISPGLLVIVVIVVVVVVVAVDIDVATAVVYLRMPGIIQLASVDLHVSLQFEHLLLT